MRDRRITNTIATPNGWLRAEPLKAGGWSIAVNDGRHTVSQIITAEQFRALFPPVEDA